MAYSKLIFYMGVGGGTMSVRLYDILLYLSIIISQSICKYLCKKHRLSCELLRFSSKFRLQNCEEKYTFAFSNTDLVCVSVCVCVCVCVRVCPCVYVFVCLHPSTVKALSL